MALALELQTPPPKQEIPASLDAPLVEAPSLEVMLTSVEHQENLILPTRESQLKSPDVPLVEAPSSEVMLTSAEHQEPKSGLPTADGQVDLDPLSCSHPHHQGLTKKHGGDNNRYQAARIYHAQCKKPEFVKEGVRKAHSNPVAKDFMKPISTFPLAEQKAILKRPVMNQLIPLKNMPNQTNFDRLTSNHFHHDTEVEIPKVLSHLYKHGVRKSVGRHTRTSAVALALFQQMMARDRWNCTRSGSTPTIKIKRDILIPKLGGHNRPLRACQKTGQVAHTAGDYVD
jgi:hypothetical protein